jgi:hypothetical protein
MPPTREIEKWEWLDLVLGEHGPAAAPTRLVLCCLAQHMNQRGESCFPSQTLIVKRSALSLRAVQKHLRIAVDTGWVKVGRKDRSGRAWFVNEYTATIPKVLMVHAKTKPWDGNPAWRRDPAQGAGRRANDDGHPAPGAGSDQVQHPAPGAEDPAPYAEDPAPGAGDTPHDVRTNSSSEQSIEQHSNVQPPDGRTAHVIELSEVDKAQLAKTAIAHIRERTRHVRKQA